MTEEPSKNDTDRRVLIIGDPYSSVSKAAFIEKFSRIFSEITSETLVVSADEPPALANVCWTKYESTGYDNVVVRYLQFWVLQLVAVRRIVGDGVDSDVLIVRQPSFILPVVAGRLLGKPTVIFLAQYKQHVLTRTLSKLSVSLTDRVIVESEHVPEMWGYEADDRKFHVAPLYVDTDRFSPTDVKKGDEFVVGYLGNLEPRKGIEKLLDAHAMMNRNKETTLYIGGTGSLAEMVSERARDTPNVDYVGFVSEQDLGDFYTAMDLFVLPSASEGLPNVVLEAMASGVPALVTPVGGIPGLITDGENGYLLENIDAENIAEKIEAIQSSDHHLVGDRARQTIEERYTFDAAVERYRGIVETSDH